MLKNGTLKFRKNFKWLILLCVYPSHWFGEGLKRILGVQKEFKKGKSRLMIQIIILMEMLNKS